MLAQRLGMGPQQIIAAGNILGAGGVRDFAGTLVIGIRHFGINRNGLASRQMHDHIRAQRTPIGIRDHHLGVEIDMFQQSGGLDNVLELGLAPRATHLVVAQRGGQGTGFLVQTGLLIVEPLELGSQCAHFPLAALFDLRDLVLQGIKILGHWRKRLEHLALFFQTCFLFSTLDLGGLSIRLTLPFCLRSCTLTFLLNANLLSLLRLGKL